MSNIKKLEEQISLLKKEISLKKKILNLKLWLKSIKTTRQKIKVCWFCLNNYVRTKWTWYKFCSKECYSAYDMNRWNIRYWGKTWYKTPMQNKQCQFCKKEFIWWINKKFCSNDCCKNFTREKTKVKKILKQCEWCKETFALFPKTRFCSRKCNLRYNSKNRK